MEYVLNVISLPGSSLKKFFYPVAALGGHVYDHFIPHAGNNYHPHLLAHRSMSLFAALLVTLKIFTIAVISFGPVIPAFSSAITPDNIIALTNQSRVQFSEATLTENSLLDQAAQAKANDMLARGYFSHNTPDGRTPWSFILAAGYNYLMAGENLAVNFSDAEGVETAWMNSPEHKANILNKNYQDIGIGISQGEYQDHTAIFVVQEFGTPAAQQISLSDQPTAVQASAVPAPAASAVPAPAPAAQQQVRGAEAQVQPSQPIAIASGNVKLDGGNVDITASVNGPATKVLAYFGQQAIMLSPQPDGTTWAGQVTASTLAQSNTTVKLTAFDMNGQSANMQLADFSPSTQDNFNLAGTTPTTYVSFFGQSFDPKGFESSFYLFFIAAMLSSLVLAIAIKRHVQHLSLIANSSFVIILATMLWMVR